MFPVNYVNGNYNVRILKDGTKIRYTEDDHFESVRPETIDLNISNYCENNCPYCFDGNAIVSTIDGDICIEDIKIGDTVFCFDENTLKLKTSYVDQLFKREYNGDIIEIELENGNVIRSTPNHKFFVYGIGWVSANDLTCDDELIDINI